ncbi:hypothetical protein IWX50DRAFT_171179 [Phyllosticta citricarpa]
MNACTSNHPINEQPLAISYDLYLALYCAVLCWSLTGQVCMHSCMYVRTRVRVVVGARCLVRPVLLLLLLLVRAKKKRGTAGRKGDLPSRPPAGLPCIFPVTFLSFLCWWVGAQMDGYSTCNFF